jgi:hypothetical protein
VLAEIDTTAAKTKKRAKMFVRGRKIEIISHHVFFPAILNHRHSHSV